LSVYILCLCIGSGFATGWSPSKEPYHLKFKNWSETSVSWMPYAPSESNRHKRMDEWVGGLVGRWIDRETERHVWDLSFFEKQMLMFQFRSTNSTLNPHILLHLGIIYDPGMPRPPEGGGLLSCLCGQNCIHFSFHPRVLHFPSILTSLVKLL
jgi:hypothetical protein